MGQDFLKYYFNIIRIFFQPDFLWDPAVASIGRQVLLPARLYVVAQAHATLKHLFYFAELFSIEDCN